MPDTGPLDGVWEDRGYRFYRSLTLHPVRWVLGLVATLVALSLVGNAVGVVNVYWQAARTRATVAPRVTIATYGTENVLHNIAYFHDQCNMVLADDQQVVNNWSALQGDEAQFKQTTDPIAQEQAGQQVSQDRVNWLGSKDQLANDVYDYNSKSATQTASPFKAHGLPYRIELNHTNGELASTVSCH